MKSLAVFIAYLVLSSSSPIANASTPILEYRYGNQIFGSRLVIFDNGLAISYERDCCPPKEIEKEPVELSQMRFNKLQRFISAGFKEENYVVRQGNLSAEGSLSGYLIVFGPDGQKLVVKSITRDKIRLPDGKLYDEIFFNDSSSAHWIEEFVTNLVQRKMPISEGTPLFSEAFCQRQVSQ